ncbi:MAG TPA: hypothetical protein PLG43_09405 [Spirochaetia bacterium]|nr:hypothetical protein [Spirochaetia bacterium]
MVNKARIEGYLINLNISFEELAPNTWLIHDTEKGLEQIIVMLEEPLVIIRVKVMACPKTRREEFFKKLLELNATDLLHGAYALEGEDVILIDTLEYETMDFEDFQASLDAIGLALAQHYQLLSTFRS